MAGGSEPPVLDAARAPILSLLVVVHDMPEQASRTLLTLSPRYQRNVDAQDYEVVVVENASGRLLGAERAGRSGPNVRYFLRQEASRSPALAMNFAAAQARGEMVAVLVDGARLLSPGIVELALIAHRASASATLAVPGYHLGGELQQRAVDVGYDERAEAGLLDGIEWPSDGYRLFVIACLSGSCAAGFFLPFAESNCLCLSKRVFDELGGFDPGFTSAGGGYVNLDFYGRVCDLPGLHFVAFGEGTFHQFHGGVTTGGIRDEARRRLMEDIAAEYRALRGKDFEMPACERVYLGNVAPNARRFVQRSAQAWGDTRPQSGDTAASRSVTRGASP